MTGGDAFVAKKIKRIRNCATVNNAFHSGCVIHPTHRQCNTSFRKMLLTFLTKLAIETLDALKGQEGAVMLKTNVRKYDIFKLYYWHGATLVGKYRLPQIKATQSLPYDVIGFNERTSVSHPENHWLDFFIDDVLFENF